MCGITGILNFDKDRPIDKDILKRMTDIINYRGPDGDGFYIDRNIGLGHRRLSIIDLSTGDQPMYSDDRAKVLVFNGEIYNYVELKEELSKKGHRFRTNSDTEVILKAYEEWGYDCQNKFNGMWSFAIWDKNKQVLFISRDRIGEKPLHYSEFGNSFIFGSEIKSLFSYGVPRIPDTSLIELYMILANIPEPYSFFKNIKKLRAGHYLLVKNNNVKEYKYWDLPEIDESNMLDEKESIYNTFEELFRDSVKIRMRSDVPFGAFLSGGLDSAAIVSTMSDVSKFPVNTFTIGFPEKEFDESKLAAEVAKKFSTTHHLGTVHPKDFNEIIDKVAYHYDEPFGDASAIPTGYVSKFASEKVKMVLTGDGGDEVLSGYNAYAGIRISNMYQKLPGFVQNGIPNSVELFKEYFSGKNRLRLNKIEQVAKTSLLPFNQRMIQKKTFIDYEIVKRLTSNLSSVYSIEDYYSDIMKKCTYKDDFYKLMYLNFKDDLPNKYLVKVDRMSMAYSLETRIPFLDYRLIEFMAGVDKKIKMQGWERKSILRNTIGKTLPVNLLSASKKGFRTPLREWFKDDSFDTILTSNLNALSDILNKKEIDKIVDDNKRGLSDNGSFIWTMMLLNKALK